MTRHFVFKGLSHPAVIPFYGVRYDSLEATKAQMDWNQQLTEQDKGIAWKMVGKQTGEETGVIASYAYKPERNKAEAGFWFRPLFWHKGSAADALQAVFEHGKKAKSLHRMEAFVEAGNTASSKLLEKIRLSVRRHPA